MSYIALGKAEGATLAYGGERPSDPALAKGWFVQPTVFTHVTQNMRLANEEVFGPVLSVIKWRDEAEMIAQVNAVEYGLTASIARRVAERGADVLITVDNGIASVEGVAEAKALGLQVLVTDHHLPGPALPAADAIVNPNQPGCTFESKSMAGVGVMFYVLLALRAELRALAERRPASVTALEGITGIGAKKRDAYGDAVLQVVAAH